MTELFWNIAHIAFWYFLGSCAFYALIVYPFMRMASQPEPRPAPRLIAVDGRRVEQR